MRVVRSAVAVMPLMILAHIAAFASAQQVRYVEAVDPITGADTSHVVAQGTSQGLEAPFIVWRCRGNSYELIASAGQYTFLDSNRITVQYRFDEREPSPREVWTAATDGTAAFAPLTSRGAFTSEALTSRQVAMRIWDYAGTAHTHIIRLTGLEDALAKLSCITAAAPRPAVTLPTPVQDVYRRVRNAIGEAPFTEGDNVLYLEGLTVTFVSNTANTRTTVRFEGTNFALWKRILDALSGSVP